MKKEKIMNLQQHHYHHLPLLFFMINLVSAEQKSTDKYKIDRPAVKKILFSYILGLVFLVIVFVLMIKLTPKNEPEIGEKEDSEEEGYRAVDIELISRSSIKDDKKLTQAQTLQEEKHMLKQSLNQN